MTQQERSGLNEAAEISVRAAGAVRGAIKTGKMVSGAAKGAAAAGPYGAAAAILWTHRKAVAAIIAGLLVLPVLFIMLLPSLIFGGLTKAGVEGSPDTPILNDNAAIVENINQISQAISDLLEEGQEDVRTRVDADFTASGADQKEIINPYESSPSYNANRFIAMYCAAKDQDYASISLKDMETLIRKAKDALYTFTSTEESRTTTVTETNTDPKTGKVTVTETEVTEIWKIYTIVYNGEAYFEDKIFALSDEQKGLAENYAQNLSVFLGDGMMQGLLPAESTGLVSLGDIRFSDGATQVVYYLGAWNSIPPQSPDPLRSYICRIVRNRSLKKLRANTAIKRGSQFEVSLSELEDCIPDNSMDEQLSISELSAQINAFLAVLPKDDRLMFVKRYWFSESISELADAFGITENNVSVRLSRIRGKLHQYLNRKEANI